ncbi:MAG: galactokinase family protein [bacterium]|nr:galactokinase family protein [bacterium]
MSKNLDAKKFLESGAADETLSVLYGAEAVEAQKARYEKLAAQHIEKFGPREGMRFVSAPGRTEIIGNHTDHNNGCVVAAAVNLDTVAAVTPNDTGVVTLYSEGYARPFVVDLADLTPVEREKETTYALIRGVAARMKELGYTIGGFDAAVTSTVFKGSGLSSSAAFEVLLCAIFDSLYNGFVVDAKLRALISQHAENVFFGKPCGLMDQMASSVGGLVAIDFKDKANAAVTAMNLDFAAAGYVPVVVTAGGEHGNLTADYAAIPAEMKQVAAALGASVLREIAPEDMERAIPQLKNKVSDRAILRALHFYDENRRAQDIVPAIEQGDIPTFLRLLIESGESSWMLLQNLYVAASSNQEMPLALEMSRRMLQGKGAWRIHGGGFAGTILAFVPAKMLEEYTRTMNAVFGEGAVTPLRIRPLGAVQIVC